jgi:hypothetical protein
MMWLLRAAPEMVMCAQFCGVASFKELLNRPKFDIGTHNPSFITEAESW